MSLLKNVKKADKMNLNTETSKTIIKLFNGVLYKNDHPKLWLELEKSYAPISDYLKPLGVEVIFDESEGYAYLQNLERGGCNYHASYTSPKDYLQQGRRF